MAIFDYNPSAITPFPYWRWNKVLPAVYDDSVSQYEMLCRLLSIVNNIIESTNSTGEQVEALTQLVQQLIDGGFPDGLVEYVNQIVDAAMADDIEAINAIIAEMESSVDSIETRVDTLEKETAYLDAKTTLRNDSAFHCVGRFILGTDTDTDAPFYGRFGLQSNCIVTKNDIDYWCVITGPDNANHFIIQRLTDGAIVCDSIFNLGHGNTMTSNDSDKLLVCDYATNKLIIIDVTDVTAPYIDQTININLPDGLSAVSASYVGTSEKVIVTSGQEVNARNSHRAFIYSDYTLTTLEKTIVFSDKFNSNWSYGFQGAYCDGKYLMFVSSNVEMVTFIDIDNGDIAFTWIPAIRYGHICVTELESFFVHNGAFYFSNLSQNGFEIYPSHTRNKGNIIKTADLLKFDPKSNENGNYVSQNELSAQEEMFRYFNPLTNADLLFESLLHKPNSNRPFVFISDIVEYCRFLNVPISIRVMDNNDIPFGLYPNGLKMSITLGPNSKIAGGWFTDCNIMIHALGNNIISGFKIDQTNYRGLNFFRSIVNVEGLNNISSADIIQQYFGLWFNNCIFIADKTTMPANITYGIANGVISNTNIS